MQSVSSEFTTRTEQRLRKIQARVLISFQKNYDNAIDFFTIGSSTIGGTDVMKGSGNVLQEWDKYDYADYSDRVLSIEINREMDPPISPIVIAQATVTLDNTDDLFTPGNSASSLDGYIIPKRPIRISVGFGEETIQKLVGLTVGTPEIDEVNKTATFKCQDFLSSILNAPLDSETIYLDNRTDQIVQGLFENIGFSASQLSLDTGGVIIPFAFFKRGMKVGDALRDVTQAELGALYMDENGVPTFINRSNWANNSSVWEFNETNTIDRRTLANSTVINVAEIISNARSVQTKQQIWIGYAPIQFSDNTISLLPGETKSVFADFLDEDGELPVTSVDDPDPVATATTSYYRFNSQIDGSGTELSADVDLDSTDVFSTAMQLTFTNNGSVEAYLTEMELQGTPARVTNRIYKRVVDSASVGTFDGQDENPIRIENDLIQDATAANSIGQIIIADRAEDDDQHRLIVKAVPQLQIGDLITYSAPNILEDYFVTRINDIISTATGYRQVLQVSKRTINSYFRIGISSIGGSDPLGP